MGSITDDALNSEHRVGKRSLSVLEYLCLTADAVHTAQWALRERLEAEGDALDDAEREKALGAIEELDWLREHIEHADCALNRLAEPLTHCERA